MRNLLIKRILPYFQASSIWVFLCWFDISGVNKLEILSVKRTLGYYEISMYCLILWVRVGEWEIEIKFVKKL